MHAFAPFSNASATPTVRQTTSKRQQTSSRSNAIARVVRANARSNDAEDAVGDATTRRRAIATLFAGAVGTAGAVGSAKADVQDYLSNLLVEKPPPPKREILLPDLEVKPLTREEGYRGTTGANKSKAQIEFAQFIAPIIEENIDMDFGSYFRLALADLGTFSVVGKKNGLNGSIRFELDRPENAGLKPAFTSIEKIKKAVDAKTTQPITYADLIAIVPHFAARRQFKADYMEEVGDDKNYEFLFIGTNPFLGAKIRIGRRDADGPDPEGLIPLVDGNAEDFIAWFRRMGLGPNELAALAPYIYEDRQKGIDICGPRRHVRAFARRVRDAAHFGQARPGAGGDHHQEPQAMHRSVHSGRSAERRPGAARSALRRLRLHQGWRRDPAHLRLGRVPGLDLRQRQQVGHATSRVSGRTARAGRRRRR
jgi:L-ascorbate peroxidase